MPDDTGSLIGAAPLLQFGKRGYRHVWATELCKFYGKHAEEVMKAWDDCFGNRPAHELLLMTLSMDERRWTIKAAIPFLPGMGKNAHPPSFKGIAKSKYEIAKKTGN